MEKAFCSWFRENSTIKLTWQDLKWISQFQFLQKPEAFPIFVDISSLTEPKTLKPQKSIAFIVLYCSVVGYSLVQLSSFLKKKPFGRISASSLLTIDFDIDWGNNQKNDLTLTSPERNRSVNSNVSWRGLASVWGTLWDSVPCSCSWH